MGKENERVCRFVGTAAIPGKYKKKKAITRRKEKLVVRCMYVLNNIIIDL